LLSRGSVLSREYFPSSFFKIWLADFLVNLILYVTVFVSLSVCRRCEIVAVFVSAMTANWQWLLLSYSSQ